MTFKILFNYLSSLLAYILLIIIRTYTHHMKRTTLQFPTIIELIDFELTVYPKDIYTNKKQVTLTAHFTEAETALAIAGFQAVIVEETKEAY